MSLLAALASCTTLEPPELRSVSQGLVSSCPFPAPQNAIDSERELVIRRLGVVEDPCRTTWNPACPDTSRARWTFGHLMAVMSGATGATAEARAASPTATQFVASWLSAWLSDQTVGTQTVAKRDNIKQALLAHWMQDSGCATDADLATCQLDLRAAPFRLLAIVNRLDMSGFDYATGGNGTGELRFVFGLYNRGAATGPVIASEPGAIVKAEAILEYRFPPTNSPRDWAVKLHSLSHPTLQLLDVAPTGTNSTSFAEVLQQQITDPVTGPNARPGNPNNGSAIGQVRVVESAFDTKTGIAATWEFRQFMLPCTTGLCRLVQVSVPQTPPTSANPTNAFVAGRPQNAKEQAISDFIVANQDAISRSRHIVPDALLGGSSLFLTNSAANLWAYPSPVTTGSNTWNAMSRHNFAFGTCNGCHYFETANQLDVFHIKPRARGASAGLSTFLTGTDSVGSALDSADGATPTYYFQVPDPAGSTDEAGDPIYFLYNEPWRRACEIRRVLTGNPLAFATATGHGLDIDLLAPPTRAVRRLAFDTTIPASDPGTNLAPGVLHGYDFEGKAGGEVTIKMTGVTCGGPDTFVFLFGPRDANGAFGLTLASNDDAGGACTLDSQISSVRLPASGTYLIIATSFAQSGSGHYSLELTCDNGACAP